MEPIFSLCLVDATPFCRDVAPKNILLHTATSPVSWKTIRLGEVTPKLCDFGLARYISRRKDLDNVATEMTVVGTRNFMAPEVRMAMESVEAVPVRSNSRIDTWATGLIAYYMYKGSLPVEDMRNFSADVLDQDDGLRDHNFHDFLLHQLKLDMNARWTAEELLEHDFILAGQRAKEEGGGKDGAEAKMSPKALFNRALESKEDALRDLCTLAQALNSAGNDDVDLVGGTPEAAARSAESSLEEAMQNIDQGRARVEEEMEEVTDRVENARDNAEEAQARLG